MAVRENLYNCILQLRELYPQTYFWIDAACINQADIPERNSQVLQMARIYDSADKVVAWLGTCPAFFEKVPAIQCFGGELTIRETTATEDKRASRRSAGAALVSLLICYLLPTYILSRRYFRRAWILQEAVLPQNLVFLLGSHEKTPEEILSGINSLIKYPNLGIFPNFTSMLVALLGGSVQRTRNLLEERKNFDVVKKWQLEQYLIICPGYEAIDPRDLIFAGLGLCNHERLIIDDIEHDPDEDRSAKLWTEFHIDYSASIKEVYINFTAALITKIGIHALSFARVEENEQKLPSWVPSFDGRMRREPLRNEIELTFRAGGHNESSNLSILPGESLLILRSGAQILDTINKSFSLYFEALYARDLTGFLAEQPQVYDRTGENMANAVARTLVADFLGDQQAGSAQVGIYLIEWLRRTVGMQPDRRVDLLTDTHLLTDTPMDKWQIHIREDLPSSQESFQSLIKRHDLRIDPKTAWYTGASLDFDNDKQRDNKERDFDFFVRTFH